MKKFPLIAACILFSLSIKGAGFNLTPGYQKAYEEILRLRFDISEDIIAIEKSSNPDNVAFSYLEGYRDFLKAIISEEQDSYQELREGKSGRLKLLSSISNKSPWHLYSQAQLNLQDGIASVKEGDYVQAAINIKKAYTQFSENKRLFPDFKPNDAGIGLLYVLVGSVPDSYKWVPGIFGMKGNVEQGIRLLYKTLAYNPPENKWPFLFNECMFITTFITFNLAGTEENISMLQNVLEDQRLKNELKNNPLLIYAVTSFLFYKGKNDKALEILRDRPKDASYYNFKYLDYLTGIAYLNKLDPVARVYFLKYTTQFKGRNFIKSAYQHLAWSYLIEGDISEYRKYISRALLFGAADFENDKEALNEANKKQHPEPVLLQARLLFDGGYYTRAEEKLKKIKSENFTKEQMIELNYRIARINHKEGNINKAKEFYFTTYKEGQSSTTYYAANSILNLGILYEEDGQKEQASWCYKECLRMDFKEYQSSIHQKAKAGLNRVNNN